MLDDVRFAQSFEKLILMAKSKEAAVYFHIGENNIRNIIKQNPDADFWFWNGNGKQIKRKLFEQYMDLQKVV